MTMSTCASCGGVLGRDCWNPGECASIAAQIAASAQVQSPPDPIQLGEVEGRPYSRYHLIAGSLIVDTTEGSVLLDAGWLAITETEYAALLSRNEELEREVARLRRGLEMVGVDPASIRIMNPPAGADQ